MKIFTQYFVSNFTTWPSDEKNTIRDRGSTALYPVYIVYTVSTVSTIYTVSIVYIASIANTYTVKHDLY